MKCPKCSGVIEPWMGVTSEYSQCFSCTEEAQLPELPIECLEFVEVIMHPELDPITFEEREVPLNPDFLKEFLR